MTDTKTPIQEFYQLFEKSVQKVLAHNLDSEVCKNLKFYMSETTQTKIEKDAEKNHALYKLDYAVGQIQGSLLMLMPENLVSSVADVLTGGSGEKKFKGKLSELDINSFSGLMEKIFKDAEDEFKNTYSKDLAFSANPKLRTKDSENFELNQADEAHDFLIENIIQLNEGKEYKIKIYTSLSIIQEIMSALGLSGSNITAPKIDISALDVSRISDIKINVTAELGRTQVPIKYALELVEGSLVELDTLNNADIKVFANGVEFAYAQIVAIEENFGLKITKIVSPEERLDSI